MEPSASWTDARRMPAASLCAGVCTCLGGVDGFLAASSQDEEMAAIAGEKGLTAIRMDAG